MKVGDICRVKYRRHRFKHEENGWLVIITGFESKRLYSEDFKEVKGVWVKSGKPFEDHQDFLEKEWLQELKAKHSVEINYDALYSLGQ